MWNVCLMAVVVFSEMSEQPGTSVNEQLWRAVEKGNEDATRYLLKKRADPNYTRTYKDLMGFEHKVEEL